MLLTGLSTTLVIGFLPKMHAVLAVTGVFAIALGGYLITLARVTRATRHAANAAERRVKVVELPRTIFPVSLDGASHGSRDADREGVVAFRVAYSATGLQ